MHNSLATRAHRRYAKAGLYRPGLVLIGIGLVLAVAPPAFAESYRGAEFNRDGVLLIVEESVLRSGDTVSVTLITLPADELGHGGKTVYLISGSAEVNCKAATIRYKKLSFQGARQNPVAADVSGPAAAAIPVSGPARRVFNYVCKNDGAAAPAVDGTIAEFYKEYKTMLARGEVK